MEKRTLTFLVLALLVWAISGTIVAGYFFAQYSLYQSEYKNLANEVESILSVNILISYGNGTEVWQNDTVLPFGSTAFKAILAIADVNYTESAFGVFVTSINGVAGNSTNFWLYWGCNAEQSKWEFPEVGASQYTLHRGDIIAWTYVSEYPPPPPT